VTGYARTLGHGSAGWFIGGSKFKFRDHHRTAARLSLGPSSSTNQPTKLYRRSSKQSFVYYFLVILGALVS
jgi:hypothetical protein